MQTPDFTLMAEDIPDDPVLVLMSSALLGPAAWVPVEAELRARGRDVVIAPPADEADPETPADAALGYATATPADRPVILIPHSNAGSFVPTLIEIRNVVKVVFVDATIPVASGRQKIAPKNLVDALEHRADAEGFLPPWTEWFSEPDVAALFPTRALRTHVERQQPQVRWDFLTGELEIHPGWQSTPAGYLAFGSTYAAEMERARALSWPVRQLNGRHLHMLVDPPGVADAILALVEGRAN
ncbi:hypothetical protein L1277_000176 [Okibacterium sp. HSC-33S16]|uniref:hypothetical protein n=1 Tax=Okibacterium sp. HSC-33S16 TaxID=2910965 RepID=UPI0020A10EFA|nr:hypothetical protein [Okibacterium sp. HSC-33S16]MCP2030112.1 hypothetical protein [Okibacterium sp. HSC-33S16]